MTIGSKYLDKNYADPAIKTEITYLADKLNA